MRFTAGHYRGSAESPQGPKNEEKCAGLRSRVRHTGAGRAGEGQYGQEGCRQVQAVGTQPHSYRKRAGANVCNATIQTFLAVPLPVAARAACNCPHLPATYTTLCQENLDQHWKGIQSLCRGPTLRNLFLYLTHVFFSLSLKHMPAVGVHDEASSLHRHPLPANSAPADMWSKQARKPWKAVRVAAWSCYTLQQSGSSPKLLT